MSFFSEIPTACLTTKNNIIVHFFEQWANHVIQQIKITGKEPKFVYADLCFRRSLAEDDTLSVNFQILENAIKYKDKREMLATIFNEQNFDAYNYFNAMLEVTNNIERLRFAPVVHHSDIDQPLIKELQKIQSLPALLLLDVFHYESITIDFLQQAVDHQADCLLYFDINSLLKRIKRKSQKDNMIRLFGEYHYNQIQQAIAGRCSRQKKENILLEAFSQHLSSELGIIAPPFCFKFCNQGGKSDFFLVFITKNNFSYELMREVMTEASQVIEEGVGNFSFDPSVNPPKHQASKSLFGPMFYLEQSLLKTFRKKTLRIEDVYNNFHYGKPYTLDNYMNALLSLEAKKQITIKRKKNRYQQLAPLTNRTIVSFNR